MEIVGYAQVRSDAKTCKGAKNPLEFLGKVCSVMEFGVDGCFLVLSPSGTALAMFDKEDIEKKFKCTMSGGTICPPNLSSLEILSYVAKCRDRKGGYNRILRDMVITASLSKGEFHDNFLWQLQ